MNSRYALEPWLQRRRFRAAAPWIRPPVLDIGGNYGELGEYLGLSVGDYTYTNGGPMPVGRFHTIAMLAVLEHMSERPKEIPPAKRLVVTTPAPGAHWILWALSLLLDRDNLAGHCCYYTRAGLEHTLPGRLIHYRRFDVANQLAVFDLT